MNQPVRDARSAKPQIGTGYPAPFAEPCRTREKWRLGDLFGLTQFGVNLTVIPPGGWSAQRHWHEREDEFVYILEGELTLIDDQGEHKLTPGMCAGFKAGAPNGHHLVNRTDKPASYIEIGTRSPDEHAHYPDIDLKAEKAEGGPFRFLHRDGSPY